MQVQLTSNNILSKFRAARKALLVVSWCFVCSIPLTLFHITRQRHLRNKLLLIIYKGAAWIANVHVHHRGKLPKEYRSLLVTNHCSYLDVIALGSLLPICFTPKKDIASWPVIGFLCKMAGVVFIERRPSKTAAHMKELEEKLDGRQMVCLFPEGTTNNGSELKPFKSSFFNLAELPFSAGELPVVPATITYTRMNGTPMTAAWRPFIAWYGDMDFFGHVWEFLMLESIDVEVNFHDKQSIKEHDDRKALASYCETVIGDHLSKTISKRAA